MLNSHTQYSSFHFELLHSILDGGTRSHMGVADHRNFLVSLAEFFFLWTHNNLLYQSAHEGTMPTSTFPMLSSVVKMMVMKVFHMLMSNPTI
jgi:hypothetical protein